MTIERERLRMKMSVGLCAFLLVACTTKPEDQPPVELQPGSYEVLVGGGTLVQLKSDERRGEVCIFDAAQFKSAPLAQIQSPPEDCSDEAAEPRGNALSGKRTCDRKTPIVIEYTGSHTADSFEFKGTVAQGSDENASVMRLGSGDFSVTGKRKGDC
jgi:hypothetical protein